MSSCARNTSTNTMLTLGLIALAVANVASYVIQRKTSLPESVADPILGFSFGVAIMTLLVGVVRRARGNNRR
jgi:hypothetical protein